MRPAAVLLSGGDGAQFRALESARMVEKGTMKCGFTAENGWGKSQGSWHVGWAVGWSRSLWVKKWIEDILGGSDGWTEF